MKTKLLKYLVYSREWANTQNGETIIVRVLTTLAIVMLSFFTVAAFGQEIVQNGQQFEKVSKKKKSEKSDFQDVITTFTYKDKTGVYPVWLSKTGKAFIWKTKKTGEKYRKYIPEIGRKINPDAYK